MPCLIDPFYHQEFFEQSQVVVLMSFMHLKQKWIAIAFELMFNLCKTSSLQDWTYCPYHHYGYLSSDYVDLVPLHLHPQSRHQIIFDFSFNFPCRYFEYGDSTPLLFLLMFTLVHPISYQFYLHSYFNCILFRFYHWFF